MLVCNQINSNSSKNEITNKQFTYKSYMYIPLNMCKQMTDAKFLLLHNNAWKHLTVCQQMINCTENYSCLIQILKTKCVPKNEPRLV